MIVQLNGEFWATVPLTLLVLVTVRSGMLEMFAWVIAESTATKLVSDQLKDWGLPRSRLKAHGYWKRDRKRPAATPVSNQRR